MKWSSEIKYGYNSHELFEGEERKILQFFMLKISIQLVVVILVDAINSSKSHSVYSQGLQILERVKTMNILLIFFIGKSTSSGTRRSPN